MATPVIFVHGKPGSGKSTCCRAAAEASELSLAHLSVGEHFRSIYNGATPSKFRKDIEAIAEQTLSVGLPGFTLVHDVVLEHLEATPPGTITLVDGFPKEPELLPLLRQDVRNNSLAVLGCIVLQIDDDASITRQLARAGTDSHAAYGTAVARQRIEQYRTHVEPTLGLLSAEWGMIEVDGMADVANSRAAFREAVDLLKTGSDGRLAGYVREVQPMTGRIL